MAGTPCEGHGVLGNGFSPGCVGLGMGKVMTCWGHIVRGLVFLAQGYEYHIVGRQKSLDHS